MRDPSAASPQVIHLWRGPGGRQADIRPTRRDQLRHRAGWIVEIAEYSSPGGACRDTRRLEPPIHSMDAERALVDRARCLIEIARAVRTRLDAVTAPDA